MKLQNDQEVMTERTNAAVSPDLTESTEKSSAPDAGTIPEKKPNPVAVFMKRHWKRLFIFVLLIYAVVTVLRVRKVLEEQKQVEEEPLQTFGTVREMDISNSIAVTGTIVSNESRTLSTLVSGTRVTEVNVEVGDYVTEGDPICSFDTSSIEEKIEKYERQIKINDAKATLALAKANTQVAWSMEDAIRDAENSQYDLIEAQRSYSDQERSLEDAIRNLETAERKLEDAEDDYKSAKKKAKTLSGSEAKSTKESAERNVESAEDSVASAESQLDSARSQLQARIDSYNKTLDSIEETGIKDGRTISQNMASVIETELNQMTRNDDAEQQIRDLREQIGDCTVTAPISGLVTSVSVVVGDEYSEKSTICVIQDDSSYKVSGTVDQYDISSIYEGMEAVVKTDATGEDELSGVLSFVSPVPQGSSGTTAGSAQTGSSSASGSTEYPIEITIEGRDERLRLGMTAESSVLTESRKGVMAVPYDAIEEDSEGNSWIYLAAEQNEEENEGSGRAMRGGRGNNGMRESTGGRGQDGFSVSAGAGRQNDFSGRGQSLSANRMKDVRRPETDGAAETEEAAKTEEDPSGRPAEDPSRDSSGESVPEPDRESEDAGNSLFRTILNVMLFRPVDTEKTKESVQTATRRVQVTTGLETDYYTEIQSEEVRVGDRVLITNSITSGSGKEEESRTSLNIGSGRSGPGGGGPGGGGPRGGF